MHFYDYLATRAVNALLLNGVHGPRLWFIIIYREMRDYFRPSRSLHQRGDVDNISTYIQRRSLLKYECHTLLLAHGVDLHW